jgi:NhaD family Na+/H+ antiporter
MDLHTLGSTLNSPVGWLTIVFIIGYIFITLEHLTQIHKTTVALLTAIIMWTILFVNASDHSEYSGSLSEYLSSISQIVFFLFGALTIVEIINVHHGFKLITDYINVKSKRQLLWILGLIAFFLSSVIDNLTTTIVMVALVKKLIRDIDDRLFIGGVMVIAANAGGAWTPIGDVTTTMLWIGGQITTLATLKDLFLPSLTCLIVALVWISFYLKGEFKEIHHDENAVEPSGKLIFFVGMASLIFVPFFKTWTGLPPYMGILLGVGVLWLVTDLVHRHHSSRAHLRVPYILTKVDVTSILFFLGILLSIDALEVAGVLDHLANFLFKTLPNQEWIAVSIGLISAIVDNVPLVAATMGMYPLTQFPQDSVFWQLIAYCAGTGGSILIIGSAAGVVFMGLENVNFFWYLRRISLPAIIGYFAGIGVYLLTVYWPF